MSDSSDSVVTLSASELRFAKRLCPYIICKVGLELVNLVDTAGGSQRKAESVVIVG